MTTGWIATIEGHSLLFLAAATELQRIEAQASLEARGRCMTRIFLVKVQLLVFADCEDACSGASIATRVEGKLYTPLRAPNHFILRVSLPRVGFTSSTRFQTILSRRKIASGQAGLTKCYAWRGGPLGKERIKAYGLSQTHVDYWNMTWNDWLLV